MIKHYAFDDYLLPKETVMNEFFSNSGELEADIDGEPAVQLAGPYNASPESAAIWIESASETFITA